MKITLALPEPPNIANARMHWAQRAREKRAFETRTLVAARNQAKRPIGTWRIVHAEAHFRLYGKRDLDNLVASLKWTLDALKGHYFTDDTENHLNLLMPTQEVNRKNRGLTLILTYEDYHEGDTR